jgi:ribonuclease P protein component
MRAHIRKQERLKQEKTIRRLFSARLTLSVYPVILFYTIDSQPASAGLKVLFSVSRRYFKTAIARNLLKRRMREAFRLNRQNISDKLSEKGLLLIAGFVYQGRKPEDYQTIEVAMQRILTQLMALADNTEKGIDDSTKNC